MPLHLPFNFPYFYNKKYPYYQNSRNMCDQNSAIKNSSHNNNVSKKAENSENFKSSSESSDYFFEIFGLKLHFDDVLIMCILFFLYKEDVHDEELFLCLILILLS